MRVAFLGMGIMGRSMAANLVKAGHEVAVWNRSAGKDVEGARSAPSPADAAEGVEVVWMCVSDTKAVDGLLFGPRGVDQVLAEGMIIADSSTISPSATRRFAERVKVRGVDYVDAPMTGSKIAAEAGQLIFMVGADEAVLARLQPLFQAMGKQVFHMGETSKGQATKLVMNLQIALIYEGFAEALALATKLGVEVEKLLPLIQASMVRSGVVEYKAPFILNRDFCIYKIGNEARLPAIDDGTLFDVFRLLPSDQIKVSDFGQIDPNTQVSQCSVEAHYEMNFSL